MEVGWEDVWSFSPTPTTSQHRLRGHLPCKAPLTTSELPGAVAGAVQEGMGCAPLARSLPPALGQTRWRTFKLSLLSKPHSSQQTLQERGLEFFPICSVLPGHDSNLVCRPADFPHCPAQHMNHLHAYIPAGARQQFMQAGDFVAQCITFLLPPFQARKSYH